MIRAEDLSKNFGAVRAVDGLSFEAANGQITTLLGGNGSGKTTTLRMIAGLIRPASGHVDIDGANVQRQRMKALSRLGVLHDDFGLYRRVVVARRIGAAGVGFAA